jgi:hypothetical protein
MKSKFRRLAPLRFKSVINGHQIVCLFQMVLKLKCRFLKQYRGLAYFTSKQLGFSIKCFIQKFNHDFWTIIGPKFTEKFSNWPNFARIGSQKTSNGSNFGQIERIGRNSVKIGSVINCAYSTVFERISAILAENEITVLILTQIY